MTLRNRWERSEERAIPVNQERELIFTVVCEHFSLKYDELVGRSKEAHVVNARKIMSHVLRYKMHWTLTKIGTELGSRDHSTISNLLNKMEDSISMRDWLYDHYLEIHHKISTLKAA